jgi:macrolide transport system ATP-binding/permease protein
MTTLMQDVRYGLRQLRTTPAFTITVLLTLALGIEATGAIFMLVNSLLLKSLPVVDPKALVRLGDNNDCCVNSGKKDSGDYGLFSTNTYQQLRKNVPEFEELAAMQASFGYGPITARRDGTQSQPRAGRLLMDADDIPGAPRTAVMSYETWQRDPVQALRME